MFTSYKQDPAELAKRVAMVRAGYAESGRTEPFEQHAVRVIAERLRAHPERYVEFGPWWWAVKQVLSEAGENMGPGGEPMVAAEYRGSDAVSTLVAAEAFKDFYRATFIVGTSTFALADDGEPYELADADMQARVGR
jgi:hypothetical protein